MKGKQELLRALLLVKDRLNKGGLDDSKYGLCFQLSLILVHDLDYILEPLFQKWPKFSGCRSYPVPYPKNPTSLFAAKCIYRDSNTPKWLGEYGRLRIELLDFLISELEKELKPA